MGRPLGDATQHGGAGALKAREQGHPFAGLAAIRAQEIGLQLEQTGPDAFIKQNAVSLQTISDLYLDAIKKASENGDQVKIDSYVKVWGWLVSSALRAMLEVRKLESERAKGKVTAYDVLQSLKDGHNDNIE